MAKKYILKDIEQLKQAILHKFREELIFCTLFIPYTKMNDYQSIKELITEQNVEFIDDGQIVNAVIPIRYSEKFAPYITEYKNI